jgi:flagellar motility protein MotE (MotC chaperone)
VSEKRAQRRPIRSSLPVIILILTGSIALRLGNSDGLLFVTNAMAVGNTIAEETAAPLIDDEETVGILLARLRAREQDLTRREEELDLRDKTLEKLSQEIGARLQELSAAEETLRQTMAIADSAAENDLENLTKVYENMKPKDAAVLFEAMEPSFAAGFLGRMQAASAAQILSGLSPEKAYAISLTLSGRNIDAPTD